MVVVWQTSKSTTTTITTTTTTTGTTSGQAIGTTDLTDSTDLETSSSDKKMIAGNGDGRNISPNEDADLFAKDEQVRSVRSVE